MSANDQIVITGWRIEMEGKKHFAGTTLFSQKANVALIPGRFGSAARIGFQVKVVG